MNSVDSCMKVILRFFNWVSNTRFYCLSFFLTNVLMESTSWDWSPMRLIYEPKMLEFFIWLLKKLASFDDEHWLSLGFVKDIRVDFCRLLNYILLYMKLLPKTVPSLFVPKEKFDLLSCELDKLLLLSFASNSSFSVLPPLESDLPFGTLFSMRFWVA